MSLAKYEASGFVPAAPDDQEVLGLPPGPFPDWARTAPDFLTRHPDWPRIRALLKDCTFCGQCAEVCPLWQRARHDDYWPRRGATLLTGQEGPVTLKRWLKTFMACTFCGRCEAQCPQWLKPYEAARLGLSFLVSVGLGPENLIREAANYLRVSNLKGRPVAAWADAAAFLSRQHEDEGLVITVGQANCDFVVVAPMADLVERPGAILGYAKFFKALGYTWTLAPVEPFGLTRLLPPGLGRELLSGPFEFWAALNPGTLLWGETPADWPLIAGRSELAPLKPEHILTLAAERTGELPWPEQAKPLVAAYFWGCRLNSLEDGGGLGQAAEKILAAAGVALAEDPAFKGPTAFCCGRGPYEPGVLEAEVRRTQGGPLLQALEESRVETVVTSCPHCRDFLSRPAAAESLEGQGFKVSSVFEILNQRLG